MIELKFVEKVFETPSGPFRALYPINLSVQAGEIFGIVGKSGAGKSTLIRCINLLERPTSGSVTVAGTELTHLGEKELRLARRRIGMIFQHFNLLASKTVFENIALPLHLAGFSKTEIKNAIQPLLELTGLTDKQDHYPAQLSGGQKQRVAIARALANKPDVLLCDEATSALDPHTTQSILALLKDINQKLQLTIVLITHEMEVVKTISTHIALLDHGQIIEQGNTLEFFKNPKTAQAKELVKSCLKQELPQALALRISHQEQLGYFPLLRIIFSGTAAAQPLISELILTHKVHLSILQANIEYIQGEPLGIMVVKLEESSQGLQQALSFFKDKNTQVEVLGYVQ